MKEYILKDEALNFEMEIESDVDEIQQIIEGMSIYAEYLKSLEAIEIPEWIPIQEKTPSNFVSILVCVDYNGFIFCDVDNYCKENKEFLNNKNYVTHWMELPNLPNIK